MFTKQYAQIKQKIDAWMPGLGDAMANIFGNCDQTLEHSGPVNLNGPLAATGNNVFGNPDTPRQSSTTFAHTTNFNQPATFNSTAAFGGAVSFSSALTLSTGYAATSFVSGTIGSALGRDGTATLTISGGTVTVHGFFVPTDFQIPNGARVGAIYEPLNERWTAVVTDSCLEAAA